MEHDAWARWGRAEFQGAGGLSVRFLHRRDGPWTGKCSTIATPALWTQLLLMACACATSGAYAQNLLLVDGGASLDVQLLTDSNPTGMFLSGGA